MPFVWLYVFSLGTSCLLERRRAWYVLRPFNWLGVAKDAAVVAVIVGLAAALTLLIS